MLICLDIGNQLLMLFQEVMEQWEMGPSLGRRTGKGGGCRLVAQPGPFIAPSTEI